MSPLHELQTRSVEAALGAALDRVAGQLSPRHEDTPAEAAELSRLAAEATAAIEQLRGEAGDA